MRVLVLHGPNLNLLGARPTQHYGQRTLEELDALIAEEGRRLGISVESAQSNHEGELLERIQESAAFDAIILNPGGYAHTSVAIRDAVEACERPVIEVHLSNVYAREAFRWRSVIAGSCQGQIAGLGAESYLAALYVLARWSQRGK